MASRSSFFLPRLVQGVRRLAFATVILVAITTTKGPLLLKQAFWAAMHEGRGVKLPESDRQTLQLQSAKQLSIRGDDDGGEAHGNCANAHGQIESPADENASCDRDRQPRITLSHRGRRRARSADLLNPLRRHGQCSPLLRCQLFCQSAMPQRAALQ